MTNVGRYPYKLLVKYPHLSQEDKLVWERFITKNPTAYNTCDYDFAVGDVSEHEAEAVKLEIAGAERVNRYRIDVIGYTDTAIHIIEIKKRAGLDTLGEIEEKTEDYIKEQKPKLPVVKTIIAGGGTLNIEEKAVGWGINLIII